MIRTLPFFLGAVMLSTTAMAQPGQQASLPADADFEQGLAPLMAQCWQLDDVKFASPSVNADYLLNGEGSVYSDPPVNNSNFRVLATPFLDVPATISLSFQYQLSSKLKSGSTRIIEAVLVDKEGNSTLLKTETLDHTDPANVRTFDLQQEVTPGVYRLAIRMGGTLGDGNCRLMVDDLAFDAPFHYSGGCNPAPVAADDVVPVMKGGILSGSGLLGNDTDPGGENLSAVLVENSADGVVTLLADGSFTFVPNEGFEGRTTTFTYQAVDDGYTPAASNTATVTIEFVEPETTVLHLLSFEGRQTNNKVHLKWVVGFNETIGSFVVEQSTIGSVFTPVKTVLASDREGDEQYEVPAGDAGRMYRLKIVDKQGRIEYSNVLLISTAIDKKAEVVMTNPVVSALEVRYIAPAAGRLTVTVSNANGVAVVSGSKDVEKGLNQFAVEAVRHLRPGTYVLTITNEQGERLSKLFLKM